MTPEEKIADLKAERKKLCDDFENMKAGLESQIATLGERCNQLLKDKGDLTDKCRELKQQIEKMKNCNNCKGYYTEQCLGCEDYCNWELKEIEK